MLSRISSFFGKRSELTEFEKIWGKGAKPEVIVLSQKDFDALQQRLNKPPDPKVQERLRELMNRPAPWDKK